MNSLKVLRDEIICGFNEEDTNNGSNTDKDDLIDTYAAKLNKGKLSSAIKSGNIVFSKSNPNIEGSVPTVVSDDPTDEYPGSAYAVTDNDANTIYIYPEVDNNKVFAPDDCSYLFVGKVNVIFDNFISSNVTNMANMFYQSGGLNSIDLSKLDTSNVTNMSNMFCNCKSLTSIDLSYNNLSNVTSLAGTFMNCSLLQNIIFPNNCLNVTSINNMVGNCTMLTHMNLSAFNALSIANNFSLPFSNTPYKGLYNITLKDDTAVEVFKSNKANNYYAFNTKEIKKANSNNITLSKDKLIRVISSLSYLFNNYLSSLIESTKFVYEKPNIEPIHISTNIDGKTVDVYLPAEKIQVSEDDNLAYASYDANNKILYIYPENDNAIMYAPEDCSGLFDQDETLYSIVKPEFTNFDTSNVINMNKMFFKYAYSDTDIDITGFNISNVTDMRLMFGNLSVNTLDMSTLDIKSNTDISDMLKNANKATVLVANESIKSRLENEANIPASGVTITVKS